MKRYTKWIFNLTLGVLTLSMASSCVDKLTFGSSFLEKDSGSTVTKDTVFGSAEYTEQYLNYLYSLQYYGLPYRNVTDQESSNIYVGKPSALTDLYVFTYTACGISGPYYSGTHTSSYGIRQDKFSYLNNNVWEAVRGCWLLMENIDAVPDLEEDRKAEMIAEAKCILATRYFDVFRHYGGVPIITSTFSGTDAEYSNPRGSVEETVEFMVNLLDEAAAVLSWNVETPASESGRWNKAAALAYKCRILQFAASPLFNDDEPYYAGETDNDAIWYGNYSSERWDDLLDACEEFFDALDANGEFYLQEASGTRPEDYRLAYRIGYADLESPEVLINTRVIDYDAFKSSYYVWHTWGDPLLSIHRGYSPTQEYMEMFPWSDGTPFDWDETESEGKLDEMFLTGNIDDDNIVLTRDPRLYEEIIVNGQPVSLDWTTGNMSGRMFESWIGGYDASTGPNTQTGSFATGYAPIKFLMGNDMLRQYVQWPCIRLSEMYLIYAEALCQTGNLSEAIEQVDIVRARVGMGGLADCNPDLNLTSDQDALLEEILRERCCELGMEDARFFDLIRYKRSDIFETQLHGLKMYRLEDGVERNVAWYGNDDDDYDFPSTYSYTKFELTNPTRYWWTAGFDSKWYLSPFPATEINKDYGLVQNPGW
ncbi:MAG: RagB/SusD family nutrient uptake outer membrane protein [Bacteroides sp.]|nr:RagB/SusD family nutrient uptake outer membrane protein [Bacteroides sp.]